MDSYLEGYIQALINVREREAKGNYSSATELTANIIEDLKRALACSRGREKINEKEDVNIKSFVISGKVKDLKENISIAINEGLGGV